MLVDPHHDPSERWASNPAPDPGEVVTLTVEVPKTAGVSEVQLRTMPDAENAWFEATLDAGASTDQADVWRVDMPCPNPSNNYRFWLGGAAGPRWLTGLGIIEHDPLDTHDFRLLTTGGAPSWVPETVWYQIFPDRFATSGVEHTPLPDWAWSSEWDDPVATGQRAMTQLFRGDLDGIAAKLDHLVDLGVGGVYLNPVFPARSNHRYDASTFDHVDPLLGGDEAWVRLRAACDRAGLRLMTDLTPNHTGDGHEWFRTAQADASSVEAGFYYFEEHPDRDASWLGVPSLPKLDHSSPELRRRMYEGPDSVVGRFLQPPYSADGWRIDVANMSGRYGMIDDNALVRRSIRRTVDEVDPSAWLVAEHFFDASRDAAGDGWHGVMNYAGLAKPIASWLGDFSFLTEMAPGPGQDPRPGTSVARTIDEVRSALPWQVVLGSMALLGSHDTARWRSMARSDDNARLGFGLLLAMPGSPCLFYGDEIGLTADDNEQARRPMPWDRSEWDESLLGWYRELIRFRRSSRALAHGGFRWVERSDDVLMFLRESADERLLIRADRSPSGPAVSPLGGDQVAGDGESFTIWRL